MAGWPIEVSTGNTSGGCSVRNNRGMREEELAAPGG